VISLTDLSAASYSNHSSATLLAPLNSASEVPPVNVAASGTAAVAILATEDADGVIDSAQVNLDLAYGFPSQVTFTGLQIHSGNAEENGPLIVDAGIGPGASAVISQPNGMGSLSYVIEISSSNRTALDAITDLLFVDNPDNSYVNVLTTGSQAGVIRGQLHRTDSMQFFLNLLPFNEVPPVAGVNALAPATVQVETLRDSSGGVIAARVLFDVNYRFGSRVEITGLHIHNGLLDQNGSVTIDSEIQSGRTVVSEVGFGNIFRFVSVSSTIGLAALNSLVSNPEKHYVNLCTTATPNGAMRAQLAEANAALPSIAPGGVGSATGESQHDRCCGRKPDFNLWFESCKSGY
jgi:CHRD domain